MRGKLNLKILVVSGVLVTVAICAMVLYGLTDRSRANKGNGGISLEAPFFISNAEAAETASAFPVNEAGMAAYVKVSKVDIGKIQPIFTELEKIGDNYIVGLIPVPDADDKIVVHLYADTDGWLVAYLGANEPAAKIMLLNTFGGATIQSTALEDALHKAGSAANVEVAPGNIKYYHFKLPEASNMTLFVKVDGIVQVELPTTYILYEASYRYRQKRIGNNTLVSSMKLDENFIAQEGSGFYTSFKTGTLHKISSSFGGTSATMLIYKIQ